MAVNLNDFNNFNAERTKRGAPPFSIEEFSTALGIPIEDLQGQQGPAVPPPYLDLGSLPSATRSLDRSLNVLQTGASPIYQPENVMGGGNNLPSSVVPDGYYVNQAGEIVPDMFMLQEAQDKSIEEAGKGLNWPTTSPLLVPEEINASAPELAEGEALPNLDITKKKESSYSEMRDELRAAQRQVLGRDDKYTFDQGDLGTISSVANSFHEDIYPSLETSARDAFGNIISPDNVFQATDGDPEQTSDTMVQAVEKDLMINDSNRHMVGSALASYMMRMISQIATHGYIKNAIRYDRDMSDETMISGTMFEEGIDSLPTAEKEPGKESSREKAKSSLKTAIQNIDKEAVLRHMMFDLTTQMRRYLNPGMTGETQLSPNPQSYYADLRGATTILDHLTEKGWLSWGRDDQGRRIPLNTEINPFINKLDKGKLGRPKITDTQRQAFRKERIEELRQQARDNQENVSNEELLKRVQQEDDDRYGPRGDKGLTAVDKWNKVFSPDLEPEYNTAAMTFFPKQNSDYFDDRRNKMIDKSGRLRFGADAPNGLSKRAAHEIEHTGYNVHDLNTNVIAYIHYLTISRGMNKSIGRKTNTNFKPEWVRELFEPESARSIIGMYGSTSDFTPVEGDRFTQDAEEINRKKYWDTRNTLSRIKSGELLPKENPDMKKLESLGFMADVHWNENDPQAMSWLGREILWNERTDTPILNDRDFQGVIEEDNYYIHPVANTMGDIGEKAYKKYKAKRGGGAASQEIANNVSKIIRDFNERLAPKAVDKKVRFLGVTASPNTGRFFLNGYDGDFYSSKELIRPTMGFHNQTTVELEKKHFDRESVMRMAYKYLGSNKAGINLGYDVNQRLLDAPAADRQTLGFYYSLGLVLLELDPKMSLLKENDAKGDPFKVINFALKDENFDRAAMIGRDINKYFLTDMEGNPADPLALEGTAKSNTNWIKAVTASAPEKNIEDAGIWELVTNPSWNPALANIPPFEKLDPVIQLLLKSGKNSFSHPMSLFSDAAALSEMKESYLQRKLFDNENEPSTTEKEDRVKHPFRFKGLIELDSRQSNAMLISLKVGDPSVASLLGVLPHIDEQQFDNLREKVFANVNNDVNTVFGNVNNGRDGDLRAAFQSFFNEAENELGTLETANLYGRGIVVAGLYGKTPRRMYSEAETMLSKIPSSIVNKLVDTYRDIWPGEFRYSNMGPGVYPQQLLRDMGAIFDASSKGALGSLLGYQDFMKSYGTLMGALDGPTIVEGLIPGEYVNLGMDNWLPAYEISDVMRKEFDEATNGAYLNIQGAKKAKQIWHGDPMSPIRVPGLIHKKDDTGVSAVNPAKTERQAKMSDEMAELETGTPRSKELAEYKGPKDNNFEGVYGSKVKFAAAPSITQQGDAALMKIARAVITRDNQSRPWNISNIHDSFTSDMDSVLLVKNAIDNIGIDTIANSARNIFKNMYKESSNHFDFVRGEVKKLPSRPYFKGDTELGEVNIGTQRISTGVKGNIQNFSGVTNYFDTLWTREQDPYGFFNEIEIERVDQHGERYNKKTDEIMRRRTKEVLRVAQNKGGWIPPDAPDASRRLDLHVTKEEFLNLLQIMEENEGALHPSFPKEKILLKGIINARRNPKWVNLDLLQIIDVDLGEGKIKPGAQGELRDKFRMKLSPSGRGVWGHNLIYKL